MKKCKYCRAKWRINYPHGRKSKRVVSFIINHEKGCKYLKHEK
jgi:hypothetical protein